MNIIQLSQTFQVRALTKNHVDLILELSRGNTLFYQYHPPFATRESIMEEMEALPPGKGMADKFYIGFFEKDRLAAVMDLIRDYPDPGTAYIGLFMVDTDFQGRGVGSEIIRECAGVLKNMGYKKLRLAVDRGNPQSNHFWRKNGFAVTDENVYICMERVL